MDRAPVPAFATLEAQPSWRTVDFISDLHLQADDRDTFKAWRRYLQGTPADALFILGDLFDAWVGDDAAAVAGFEAECTRALCEASDRRPTYFMHGNRDFLVGPAWAAACGVRLLEDPTVLVFAGQRWLLTHGDALCLADRDYLRFREQVRTPGWSENFLRRPLAERQAMARQMRTDSQSHQEARAAWADVDADAAGSQLEATAAAVMIHGHTHRPGEHALAGGRRRIVLSDWDARAQPPRLQALRLARSGELARIDLS